jgi:hypothetical protein
MTHRGGASYQDQIPDEVAAHLDANRCPSICPATILFLILSAETQGRLITRFAMLMEMLTQLASQMATQTDRTDTSMHFITSDLKRFDYPSWRDANLEHTVASLVLVGAEAPLSMVPYAQYSKKHSRLLFNIVHGHFLDRRGTLAPLHEIFRPMLYRWKCVHVLLDSCC